MVSQIEIRNLKDVDFSVIYNGFKEAFSDYFVSTDYLSEEGLKQRFIKNNVDYSRSSGAFADNRLVGFTMVGVDVFKGGLSAFDAATGIIKDYRGQGLAGRMFDYSLIALKELDVETFFLEVLQPNEHAINVYKKTGFTITREFKCYDYDFSRPSQYRMGETDIRIVQVDASYVKQCESLMTWVPSWENSVSGMMRIKKDLFISGAFKGQQCIGLIVYYPLLKWVMNLTVDPEYRDSIAGELLVQNLQHKLKGSVNKMAFNNVDASDRWLHELLIRNGFSNVIDQFEMKMKLHTH